MLLTQAYTTIYTLISYLWKTALSENKFSFDNPLTGQKNKIKNALFQATRPLNWFVYGIAVFENYTDYPTMREVDKKRIVFDLIKQGLHDIAEVDKLDTEILDEVLDEAKYEIFKKYKYLDKI